MVLNIEKYRFCIGFIRFGSLETLEPLETHGPRQASSQAVLVAPPRRNSERLGWPRIRIYDVGGAFT